MGSDIVPMKPPMRHCFYPLGETWIRVEFPTWMTQIELDEAMAVIEIVTRQMKRSVTPTTPDLATNP